MRVFLKMKLSGLEIPVDVTKFGPAELALERLEDVTVYPAEEFDLAVSRMRDTVGDDYAKMSHEIEVAHLRKERMSRRVPSTGCTKSTTISRACTFTE